MTCRIRIFAAHLLVGAAMAVAQTEESNLQSGISPGRLEKLLRSRERGDQELRRFGQETFSSQILSSFLQPRMSLAVVRINQIVATNKPLQVDLHVEKLLRGTFPDGLMVEWLWSSTPWVLRPPVGAQRIKPEAGKRILASFIEYDNRTFVKGILDLSDPAEAAFLPGAVSAAQMDTVGATAGFSTYKNELTNGNVVVRDLALRRLATADQCRADRECEGSILAAVRHLLGSSNPNDRMEGVEWLDQLIVAIQQCQLKACNGHQFRPESVRQLLQSAVADKNVAVGDRAFEYLAALDFDEKQNAGYCEEIVPALRRVERYPSWSEHMIGGSLSASSVCVGKTHSGHQHKGNRKSAARTGP